MLPHLVLDRTISLQPTATKNVSPAATALFSSPSGLKSSPFLIHKEVKQHVTYSISVIFLFPWFFSLVSLVYILFYLPFINQNWNTRKLFCWVLKISTTHRFGNFWPPSSFFFIHWISSWYSRTSAKVALQKE
jgi:hypothetical protein